MHGTIDLAGDTHQSAARDKAARFRWRISTSATLSCSGPNSFWPYFDGCARKTRCIMQAQHVRPYWSVTKYKIMDIETNHSVFSFGGIARRITVRDIAPDLRRESFIAMDQPRHSAQRKTVAPMFHADPSRRARDQHPQAVG